MPDLVTKLSAVVRFSTSSDDCAAIVRGRGIAEPIVNGAAVPTQKTGLYTVSVFDRRLRHLSATLTDSSHPPSSTPPSVTKGQDELVILLYEVL
jgi:hypothetical protein